jgi:phosphate transport system protein
MLRAIINLFRSQDPLGVIGDDFARMLETTQKMAVTSGRIFFGTEANPAARTNLYHIDVEVNRIERSIRKALVMHLSMGGNERDVPYSLALMSLVKDVERIGDYAKNLAEIEDIYPGPLPEGEISQELQEIRTLVESTFAESIDVVARFDHDLAVQLLQKGRNLTKRCDSLIHRIAHSEYDASTTTALVLGARYYKRIAAHLLNVLTAVVMPLHKLDYYDEDAISRELDKSE